mgnify:CR=1 FL=1
MRKWWFLVHKWLGLVVGLQVLAWFVPRLFFQRLWRGRRVSMHLCADCAGTARRIESPFCQRCSQPFDGATVVVSHHCPHATCVATKFRNSPANPGFASDLSELFSAYSIAAWCHGHTHCSLDHYVGETRIICNPRGYAQNGRPENERFDPALIVEI